MSKTTYFPVFVDIKEKYALVFGAGTIAERRIKTLLDFGARVTAVAPDISDGLTALALDDAGLTLIKTDYESWRIAGGYDRERPFIAVAATDNHEINREIACDCRIRNIIVNVCDDAKNCDFFFPAVARKDEMVIGISGDGKSHGRVRDLAAVLREFLKELEL